MIVPSIDLRGGSTVQLVGGREQALDAGDPMPIAEKFAIAGEVAVIDLDAAIGTGSNREQILPLLNVARCRVGGGIRSVRSAIEWLDAGATKIVLGTAANREVLRELPRERVIAALDADAGEVVVEGWRRNTGESILDRMRRLEGLVGGFLITFVEREGRLGGVGQANLELIPELVATAARGGARVTIAGGVTTPEDIAVVDRMGADAQVGMALYTGRLALADAIAAPLVSDRQDGLWPTVVVDEHGLALGLAYSNLESLREAVQTRSGVYHSRTRGLWRKGESSGAMQQLLSIDLDCDRDTLRFTVRQTRPGFCHNGTRTCWGESLGLAALERRLAKARQSPTPGSYTSTLYEKPDLLRAKLVEEAGELADADSHDGAVHELADVLYFALVGAARWGVDLSDAARELDRRALRVTRRGGEAKALGENRP